VLFIPLVNLPFSFLSTARELRYAAVLLAFIFTARALSTPGTPVVRFGSISVTGEGIYTGGLVCWRLAAIIIIGIFFVLTTRLTEIKTAVEWYLKPLPFVPEKRIGTMLSLIVRFLPVIMEEARETSNAQRARCIENRKNPVYRIMNFSIPLFRRTFQCADKLALAMEARCYSDNRTDSTLTAGKKDWMVLLAGFCLSTILLILD